jgi:UDP-N-acetylmuramoyl-tripeptide--D-alanyl-D-alanine ligase
MIRNFLSRCRPAYIRTLVYMMQASEYYVADYLRWYHHTKDFRVVEHRKRIVYTAKAIVLLVAGHFILALSLGVILFGLLSSSDVFRILAAALFLTLPLTFPYLMVWPLFLLNLCQAPVEFCIVLHAKRKLRRHKGVRIAIAGSFGKTSMREILKAILSEGKKVASPGGSHNTPLAISSFIRSLTGNEEVLIFEFGEYYPGDIKKLCKIVDPQWGIITGVNEAHLERFKDIQATRATIFELADFLAGRPLYVNNENEIAFAHAPTGSITYDRHGAGAWHVDSATAGLSGTSLAMSRGIDRVVATTRLLGLHNVGPLAACADIATRLGLSPKNIEDGITKTVPFEHRLQAHSAGGITTIDDSYNGNPDGVKAATEFLGSLQGVRRWYVTPGLVEMGSRKKEVHLAIGKQIADAGIEKAVLIKNSVTPYIAEGIKSGAFNVDIFWFDDALAAFKALPSMTAEGDVVLIQNDWPDQYF